MSPDDALCSLRRHATSKIAVPKDLNNIETLGFRGEALPSIASVSRLTLVTKERGAVAGTRSSPFRDRLSSKPMGAPEGTKIEVRDLFFNTPARRSSSRLNRRRRRASPSWSPASRCANPRWPSRCSKRQTIAQLPRPGQSDRASARGSELQGHPAPGGGCAGEGPGRGLADRAGRRQDRRPRPAPARQRPAGARPGAHARHLVRLRWHPRPGHYPMGGVITLDRPELPRRERPPQKTRSAFKIGARSTAPSPASSARSFKNGRAI